MAMRTRSLVEDLTRKIHVRKGPASATLTGWRPNIHNLNRLQIPQEQWDNYVFITDLTSGGVKGAGLPVLQKTIDKAKQKWPDKIILLSASSIQGFTSRELQDATRKLYNWYLSTGLFEPMTKTNIDGVPYLKVK